MSRRTKILIGLPILLALLVLGFLYFTNAFAGVRIKRELNSFADALETCTPLDQDYFAPMLGKTMFRSVEGEREGGCVATFAAIGATAIHCLIPDGDREIIVDGFRKRAEATPKFALSYGMEINYDSRHPDPLTTLMSGPACTIER